MIAKLTGLLDCTAAGSLIIDVSGVGYQVFASSRTLSRLGSIGDQVSLLIETVVREDSLTLYGFIDAAEKAWFSLLTSVQGVGAKAALAILSVCPAENLPLIVASSDSQALRAADGVGPKLAIRIVTELKDKVEKLDLGAMVTNKAGLAAPESAENVNDLDKDALSALMNLGYGRSDAYQAIIKVKGKSNDNSDLQVLLKMALKELSS
jgi:Holliday junction DNA helicase RuvA